MPNSSKEPSSEVHYDQFIANIMSSFRASSYIWSSKIHQHNRRAIYIWRESVTKWRVFNSFRTVVIVSARGYQQFRIQKADNIIATTEKSSIHSSFLNSRKLICIVYRSHGCHNVKEVNFFLIVYIYMYTLVLCLLSIIFISWLCRAKT